MNSCRSGCENDPPRFGRRARGAFTLVELLVVIAIIGVLVSLLMPAVQAVRESARKTACQNHLKQIGTAFHLHHDLHRHWPTGGWGFRWAGDPDRGFGGDQPGGWIFNVLPFIEQQNVRDMAKGTAGAQKSAATAAMLQLPVALFYCPSRRAVDLYEYGEKKFPLYNADPVARAAKSDYAVNGGHQPVDGGPGPPSGSLADLQSYSWPPLLQATGVCFVRSRFRMADIKDGLSHTCLVGEKYLSIDGAGTAIGDDQAMYIGDDADVRRWTYQPPARDHLQFSDPHRFGGPHRSGCQIVFCDGSVGTVSFTVDADVFRQMGHRKDGRPAGGSD